MSLKLTLRLYSFPQNLAFVDGAVIHDEDTVCEGIRVHLWKLP
jgi:hypothetical protein